MKLIDNLKNLAHTLWQEKPSQPSPPPKTALVLGGGVALGMAHIGVIQVLEERHLLPDLIVGTSAGSMVGAMYCSGTHPAQMLEQARKLSWRRIGRVCMPRMGLMDGTRMETWLEEVLMVQTFEECRIPFAAVVTNLNTTQKEIIQSGSLAKAVHASCALPGIFKPVSLNDQMYVDGGLVDEVPVSSARELGATRIIAVQILNTAACLPPPRNIFEVILRGQFIRGRRLNAMEVQDADVHIVPETAHLNAFDMDNADTLVTLGKTAAEKALSHDPSPVDFQSHEANLSGLPQRH